MMNNIWDIQNVGSEDLIFLKFQDGVHLSTGEWLSFQDEVPGLDVYANDEIALFNEIVATLAPKDHFRSCARWEIDQRFFFPKPPRYQVEHIHPESANLQNVFSGDWGSGWGDNPHFLFISQDHMQHADKIILENSKKLQGLDMKAVDAGCAVILDIATRYKQILYVHDYELGYIQKIEANMTKNDYIQLTKRIQSVATKFNLAIPNLFGD